MQRTLRRILVGAGAVLGLAVVAGGAFVAVQVVRFNSSMGRVYAVPAANIERSTAPAVLARGEHLARSVGGCATPDCHGTDLGGGKPIEAGPVGTFTGPNISQGGLGAAYTDGELFRLIRHGLKRDGRSLVFMPSHELGWLPDSDIAAMISYVRTVPPVHKPNGPMRIGLLGKVLDRHDRFVLDVARRIPHDRPEVADGPTADAKYGRFLAKGCVGCHGEGLSGGPIPGAPPEFPVPSNLTPHATGLKDWTYADFERLLASGIRKNGKKLDPFMPLAALSQLDEVERQALWAHLTSLPARPFGER